MLIKLDRYIKYLHVFIFRSHKQKKDVEEVRKDACHPPHPPASEGAFVDHLSYKLRGVEGVEDGGGGEENEHPPCSTTTDRQSGKLYLNFFFA